MNREIFSAWVDTLSSSLFEHLKTVMASLDFQGEGVVSVYTNCDITKMYTGRVSRELVGPAADIHALISKREMSRHAFHCIYNHLWMSACR